MSGPVGPPALKQKAVQRNMNESMIDFPRGQEALEAIHRDPLDHRLFRGTVLDGRDLFDAGDHEGMAHVSE